MELVLPFLRLDNSFRHRRLCIGSHLLNLWQLSRCLVGMGINHRIRCLKDSRNRLGKFVFGWSWL